MSFESRSSLSAHEVPEVIPLTHRLLSYGPPIGNTLTGAQRGEAPVAVKLNTDAGCLWAQYEYICAWLARLLGLRCAPVQLTVWEGQIGCMSLWIDDPNVTPAPAIPTDLVMTHPDVAAGVLMFDQWIGNHDRHARNLVLSESGEPVLIDHSQAFFGAFRDTQIQGIFREWQSKGINDRHCLLRHVNGSASMFHPWFARLDHVTPAIYGLELELLVRDGYLTATQAGSLLDLLSYRRTRIQQLMTTMLPHLEGW